MQLIYRGFTYTVQPTAKAPSFRCHVVNWRYQVLGVACEPAPVTLTNHRHPVINWRYQTAAMA